MATPAEAAGSLSWEGLMWFFTTDYCIANTPIARAFESSSSVLIKHIFCAVQCTVKYTLYINKHLWVVQMVDPDMQNLVRVHNWKPVLEWVSGVKLLYSLLSWNQRLIAMQRIVEDDNGGGESWALASTYCAFHTLWWLLTILSQLQHGCFRAIELCHRHMLKLKAHVELHLLTYEIL